LPLEATPPGLSPALRRFRCFRFALVVAMEPVLSFSFAGGGVFRLPWPAEAPVVLVVLIYFLLCQSGWQFAPEIC
jgi:hypothetical protein